MSLNKRSLRRDALPAEPLEDKLARLGRHIKTRRGANRRAAFDALATADGARAVAVVEGLAQEAKGKNQAELGGLLASTGIPHLVDACARGRFGDVDVHAWAPPDALARAVEGLPDALRRMAPAEVERRARALGLLPLRAPRSPAVERALLVMLDDARLPLPLRTRAAEAVARIAPAAVWARRDEEPVPWDLGVAAGLAARYVPVDGLDDARLEAALAALPPAARVERMATARLPRSLERFSAGAQLRLHTLLLDTPGADDEGRVAAAQLLARLGTPEARDAVLARPGVHLPSTVAVCESVHPEEARDVLGPLLRARADARDAVAASDVACAPGLVDDALAVLAEDPVGALSLLARMGGARARGEIVRIFEAVDVDDAGPLLAALTLVSLSPATRAAAARTDARAAVSRLAALAPGARPDRALRVKVLEALLPRARSLTADLRRALDGLDA